MRLQEICTICKDVLNSWPRLALEEKKDSTDSSYYVLANIEDVKAILKQLESINCFNDNIAAIRRTSVDFELNRGKGYINKNSRITLTAEYNTLKTKVVAINELFDSVDYKQNENGLDIKLPPNISLAELSKCTRDLDKVFSTCPILSKQEGEISFTAVDVGSAWLTFAVAGASIALLKAVAELVDKAIIIRSHNLSCQQQKEQVRSLEMGNEMLDTIVKVHEEMGAKLLNKMCAELAEKNSITEAEDRERIRNSIQLLSDWMGKGMEIYASIQSAPEVKAVFPPIEKQALPSGRISLLTDGEEKGEE